MIVIKQRIKLLFLRIFFNDMYNDRIKLKQLKKEITKNQISIQNTNKEILVKIHNIQSELRYADELLKKFPNEVYFKNYKINLITVLSQYVTMYNRN